LTPGGTGDKGFTVEYFVKDRMGNTIHDFGSRVQPKPGTSAVLANALDIRPLDPGDYYLILEVEDPATGRTAVVNRRFSLVDPNPTPASTVDEKDVQLMQNIAWFHLSEAEKIRIRDLSLEGKANMIRQFWRNQDDTPGTPDNAVYDEAVRRYAYANENFSTVPTDDNGWRTDRGRVYITYGPPNEVDEHVMSGKSYPYYKWTYYDVAGGCVFVFVNDFVAGAVDYRLVHSTHPREKYDSKWQAILEEEDTQDNTWKDAGEKDF
jgi:GWxTD domain-containing protein